MAGLIVSDQLAVSEANTNRDWRRATPLLPEIAGWQIIVTESTEAAHRGLQREHEIADEVGRGAHKPTIFIWRSQRALIVARGQTRWPEFEAAAAQLTKLGWPVLVRRSGGGAFPVCPGYRTDLHHRQKAASVGDAPGAFCAGRHDLVVGHRKIAGLAQYWRVCRGGERCITAAASVLVDARIG